MNITEFKLDALKRGFVINERFMNLGGLEYLITQIQLHDRDGLFFQSDFQMLAQKYGSEEHIDSLRQVTRHQDNLLSNRHTNNPNTCTHHPVQIGNTTMCVNCMAKLGEKIAIELKYN